MTPSKGTSFWVWLTIGLIGLGLTIRSRTSSGMRFQTCLGVDGRSSNASGPPAW